MWPAERESRRRGAGLPDAIEAGVAAGGLAQAR